MLVSSKRFFLAALKNGYLLVMWNILIKHLSFFKRKVGINTETIFSRMESLKVRHKKEIRSALRASGRCTLQLLERSKHQFITRPNSLCSQPLPSIIFGIVEAMKRLKRRCIFDCASGPENRLSATFKTALAHEHDVVT